MRNITKFSIAALVIGIGSLLISYISGPSYAANIDNTPDCDNVAIFYCGAMNEAEFHRKWNNDGRYKDHQTVFAAFGINKNDVNGMVDGIVWKDGRVTLGNDHNNVVATNAITAGRNWGTNRTPIANTNNAAKFGTRDFATEGQTAMIKMVNGEFKFAVIKSCGNPVTANPVKKPETPKPQPKDIKVCELETMKVITIKEDQFNNQKHSKILEDCDKQITVCELDTKKVVEIKEKDFTESKYSKDLSDCDVAEPVNIKVCDVNQKMIIEIDEADFNKTIHTKDLSKCDEQPEEPKTPVTPVAKVEPEKPAPAELPQTGALEDIFGTIGIASLASSSIAYVISRRHSLIG